ncbi:hypothetical protein FACS1894172_08610 [Spirochaetia bacterium]|nr:hypothetical protein FACS1894164_09710 [Spirochaetia bacterium]GHU32276.1 hypothetical protein FACS1894172_08610 [Spirochaetia bacterium]
MVVSCSNPADTSYRIVFPEIPDSWHTVLGTPEWYVEWVDSVGILQSAAGISSINAMPEWTTPVLAYPYWPERGVAPKTMKPAGGLFPFDRSGDRIVLSWRGGVDAVFYQEVSRAAGSEKSPPSTPRIAAYFNWPMFRELCAEETLNPEIQNDPWRVNWNTVAARTVQSGFSRRALSAEPVREVAIPVEYDGLWIATSPFSDPVVQNAGNPLSIRVTGGITTFVSGAGILRYSAGNWILIPAG